MVSAFTKAVSLSNKLPGETALQRTVSAGLLAGAAMHLAGGDFRLGFIAGAMAQFLNAEGGEQRKTEKKEKWVNPTGGKIRGCDSRGCGSYGASRGSRSHAGTDYEAREGQDVFAVADGKITKIGHPYSSNLSYRYITIETTNGEVVRQLYVNPAVNLSVGDLVSAGQIIGTYQELGSLYPGITEHVHVDIWYDNGTPNPWATGGVSIDPVTLIESF